MLLMNQCLVRSFEISILYKFVTCVCEKPCPIISLLLSPTQHDGFTLKYFTPFCHVNPLICTILARVL